MVAICHKFAQRICFWSFSKWRIAALAHVFLLRKLHTWIYGLDPKQGVTVVNLLSGDLLLEFAKQTPRSDPAGGGAS
jgi:hypothetical protein